MANQTKIKLLIFIPALECGGMEKYTSLLCNHINTGVFDVTLAVLNNAHPFFTINNKAVTVVDLHEPHVRFAFFKIMKTIKNVKPDIVFTTGNHLNLYMAIFRKFISKKIKVIGRETSIVSFNNRRAKFPLLYNRLVKKYYSNLDFIISQSQYMQKDLIANYHIAPEKSMVIYNPVESDFNQQQAFAHTENKIYKFITVARLSEEKGLLRLIESVALLQVPFVYYIIGGGKMHALLQQQINTLQLTGKVFLLGKKLNPFEGMEDADLFLMGSHYEGLGNVLLEAGARGIPVVAFEAPGGIAEVITTGKNGMLAANNNIKAFAVAVQQALQIQFNRNEIIAATQKRFSVHTIIAQIENIFIKLASKSI